MSKEHEKATAHPTARPWRIVQRPDGHLHQDIKSDTSGQRVASISLSVGKDESEANAALIVRAVNRDGVFEEMLAALEAFERINELWLPGKTINEEYADEARAIHAARDKMLAAIERATKASKMKHKDGCKYLAAFILDLDGTCPRCRYREEHGRWPKTADHTKGDAMTKTHAETCENCPEQLTHELAMKAHNQEYQREHGSTLVISNGSTFESERRSDARENVTDWLVFADTDVEHLLIDLRRARKGSEQYEPKLSAEITDIENEIDSIGKRLAALVESREKERT